MGVMPIPARRLPLLALAAVLAAALAACGVTGPGATGSAATSAAPSTAGASPAASDPPSGEPSPTEALTPVPGGASPTPDDSYGGGPTMETEWGTILINLPEGFPVYPGAAGVEPMDGPATHAWEAVAPARDVAAWYAEGFEAIGWSRIDLGSPLEDGTQVLDLGTDLPECRVQLTFRPLGESTMIILLYGAGCGGAVG
jgi:hypothetical protein